ncbi:MAG: hypothetical protein QM744_02855 [Mesorhizobium sp.]
MDKSGILAHDLFPHIRIVMGMIIGLGVTRLLAGVARIIQHPGQYKLYIVHLAWVASVLLMLIHFWWWEFDLYAVQSWTFGKYLFLICYSFVLFMLTAFLFPESMRDYFSYEDYFYSIRPWFFGLLALSYLLDIMDTLLKGPAHFAHFGNEFLIRTPVLVAACAVAILTTNRRFHLTLVLAIIAYQVSWILRLFDTLI